MDKSAMSVAQLNGGRDALASLRGNDAGSSFRLRAGAGWSRLNLSGSDGFSAYRATNRTLLLSGERSRGGLTLGIAGGLGETRLSERDFGGRTSSDDFAAFAYGRYDCNGLFIASRLGVGHSDITTDRRIPVMAERARGEFSARYISADVRLGHDFILGAGWGVTVSGGVAWQKTLAKSFRESGSNFALDYAGWHADSFEALGNARVSKRFDLNKTKNTSISPWLNLGLSYELGDRRMGGTSAFSRLPDFPSFRAEASRIGRLKTSVGAGIDWRVTKHLGLTAEYNGAFRQRAIEHSARVSLDWSW